jgi:hypothetical protein
MRKLLTFLIALAAVAFLNVSAHAFGCKGWPQLSGGNGCNSSIAAAGGGTPTLAYIGIVTPTYSSGVATATGAAIGTAAADRLVVVVFFDETATNTSLSSVTIGGVTATVNTQSSGGVGVNVFVGIASLNVPAGATATIVATYANSGNIGRFQVYTVNGLSSFTPTGAGNNWKVNTGPISTTLATTSGGVVIVGGAIGQGAALVSTFSGTETYTTDSSFDADFGSNSGGVGHATGIATNAASTVSDTFTGDSGVNHLAIAAVSWR